MGLHGRSSTVPCCAALLLIMTALWWGDGGRGGSMAACGCVQLGHQGVIMCLALRLLIGHTTLSESEEMDVHFSSAVPC